MTERLQLPVRPAGSSLSAQVAALDLLAARLDVLASRARWPARIPLNSKASFDGDVVHPDQLHVHVGGEWWVEMSAAEAAAYVRRRKAAFLDEHARLLEGKPRAELVDEDVVMVADVPRVHGPSVKFDPLFAGPARVPSPQSTGSTAPAASAASAAKNKPSSPLKKPETSSVGSKPSAPAQRSAFTAAAEAPSDVAEALKALPADLPPELQHFVDMLKGIPKQNGADETITEDGLPIQEIREAPDGSTITAPEGGESAETVREDTEDYWSEEAAARRAALRRQIFHEGSDDDEDEEKEEDGGNDKMDVDPAPASLAPPRPQTPVNQPPTHSPNRSPQNPPKSILKAPSGKKSVTFDPSTRLPPDSPPVSSPIGAFGSFPVGSVVTDNVAAGLKTVPILAPPTPGRKPAPTPTFAGFKRGFLTGPGSKPPPIPAPSSAVIEGSQAVDGDGDVEMESKEGKEEKKKSIFAQRRAERAPSFPRLADAKPMVTMKTNIVEKPPSIADRIQTSGVRTTNPLPPAVGTVPPAVGAVPPVVTPAPVPSVPAPAPTPSAPVVIVDHDDDESDYGDLGEFSDDEEDEYHLDEALMQREIQLALHRGQRWQPPVDSDEEGEEDEEDDGEGTGGVLMGVPRVSTITGSDDDPLRIVNPTADDLSQFLRVGRAEDGELVFERPIVDDSGSDGEGSDGEGPAAADRRARRARRNDVMERLMRGEYEDEPVQDSPAVQAAAWKNTLPPSVGAAVPAPALAAPASAPTPAPPVAPRRIETGPVIERSSAPLPSAPAPAPSSEPKKVSRFKAARQAQS